MRITKLRLNNFRSYSKAEIDCDRLVVVRGLNGSGKSSIQMAIEYGLTGRCQVTDGAGRGAESLIRLGTNELAVDLEFHEPELGPQDGSRLTRTRSRAGGTLRLQGPDFGNKDLFGKLVDEWISQQVAPLPVLSAVLNAGPFLQMSEKDQRALLADALASDPVEIAPEMVALLASVFADGANFKVAKSAGAVDAFHRRCYEERTQVNRDLRNLGEVTPPEVPKDMPSAESVQAKIAAITEERNAVVGRRAGKLAAHEASKREQARVNDRRTTIARRRQELQPQIIASTKDLDVLRKVAESQAKLARIDAEIATLHAEVLAKRNAISDWKTTPTTCDKCGAPLKLTQADIAAKVAELERGLSEAEGNLKEKQAARLKLGDPSQAQRRIDQHRAAMSEDLQLASELEKLAEIVVGEEPDVSAEDKDLASIDERLANGRQILAKVQGIESAQLLYKHGSARQKELKERSSALDKLVEYFSDAGPLKAKLIGGRLPAFRDRINDVLARFGCNAEFEIDPYKLRVNWFLDDPTKSLELSQLSESQAFRFGIAFQIALAEATGVKLVIIDRADMLQPDTRRVLTEMLLESNLDQAFLLATGEPFSEVPSISEVCWVSLRLANGVTEVQVISAPKLREVCHAAE